MNFSVRGPHGTVPWLGFADYTENDQRRRVTVLMWARNEEEAVSFTRAWSERREREVTKIQTVRCNPDHHLGSVRVVEVVHHTLEPEGKCFNGDAE